MLLSGQGKKIVVYLAFTMPSSLPEGFPPPTPPQSIEVKDYPAYRAATVRYEGDLGRATGFTFEPLFRHISTNNIAMTSPVEARYLAETRSEDNFGQAEVSFLYRSVDILPERIASGVEVVDREPMQVVSTGVQGNYSWANYCEHIERLRAWLALHPEYKPVGVPRRFFYDSPFVAEDLKRSEVQIPVERTGH
ncbi:MAG: heme-binding protein [Gemmatimonadaceae bacterium]|nr:heme-binding protein [Gloeobacterales cyanobacterium ES-bin-141]